ncbi:sulfatase [Haloferula chungangensis]|uniref:Sulfatase n=1 Tax=Haloferula chungangensis TaxID=1048331 RepID=A0ABW2KZX5_9BACT
MIVNLSLHLMRNSSRIGIRTLLFVAIAANLLCASPADERPPNIVFILADDLGITDINAFASHFTGDAPEKLFYETPHLDQLASDGIPFSQSYANQLCSPTRAAILSGRIASRLGFTTATPNTRTYFNQGITPPEGASPHDAFAHKDSIKSPQAWINANSNTALDPEIPTLPQVLKTYDSAFLGKWHLGGHGVSELQPSAHGFRELAFLDAGGSPYFSWQATWNNRKAHFPKQPGEYRIGQAGKPTGEDYLTDDLTARACNYIRERAALPKGSKPFLLYYCPFAVHTPLQAPAEDIAHFEEKKQRGHLGHNNPTYAAMLKHLDISVGEIRQALEETGLSQDTIIVFTSDNGGVEYTDPAATDNQPFKGGKACLYEGGVRVPTIIYWPDHYEGGTWCNQVIDATDFLPTLAELSGNPLPDDIDGLSLIKVLKNPEKEQSPRTLIWHYPFNVIVKHPDHGRPLTPHSAIRVGDHKLIWDWHGSLELYDIPSDPYEENDLASTKPELTSALHQQLKQWLSDHVAKPYFPTPNPHFDPEAPGQAFPFKDLR